MTSVTPNSEFLARARHSLVIGEDRPDGPDLIATTDPATGEVIAEVAGAALEQVDMAVQAAETAFRGVWGRLAPAERQDLLLRYADAVEAAADELALIETLDNGMPLAAAKGSVARCVAHLRYNAGWATKLTGATITPSKPGRDMFAYTLHQPLGVVAAIVPWNSPMISTMLKISAALAAGCTVVVKPATFTPLAALRLAELALEAGIPPGVVNVLVGSGGSVGRALVTHPSVRKISFTGSTEVGQQIARDAAERMAHTTLELGGKSPDIVFDDVELDDVVPKAAWAVFRNSGQVCVAGSRLLVQEQVYDEFVARLVDFTATIRVGSGLDPETNLGPLITAEHTESVLDYVAAGVAEGADLVTGGQRIADAQRVSGQFVEPTIFRDVGPEMRIVREEIFGPVVVVSRFADVGEAIAEANDTPYGLAAGIWTRDVGNVHRVAAGVDAGMVWANCYSDYDPALPFGGHKMSGQGAKSGREAVFDCTDLKTVVIELPQARTS